MSTTKIWLQAISRIQTGKQNSIAIRAKIVSLLPCPWSNRSSKSQIEGFVLTKRYSCGCAVPSTCKDYGEENHGWSYLFKPLDAALRQLRSDRDVVKILRLVVAVSTIRISLLLAAVTLQTHTWLIAICFVVSINGWNRDTTVSYLFSRSNSLAACCCRVFNLSMFELSIESNLVWDQTGN
ncbi:hypothetical protein Bca4012_089461 [Brassica carinata]